MRPYAQLRQDQRQALEVRMELGLVLLTFYRLLEGHVPCFCGPRPWKVNRPTERKVHREACPKGFLQRAAKGMRVRRDDGVEQRLAGALMLRLAPFVPCICNAEYGHELPCNVIKGAELRSRLTEDFGCVSYSGSMTIR